ncbi:hypothetical protein [Anaeromyxobacter oryzae]|uniref:Uncharacterized protein n=1 Tax=Anaeromyxobacter oryzae TaxID=2918170 RepID=A0ABM7X1R1_9BACT|nr:hypothetical protein [Anaeromyxobacter oryzae]BDG05719.1 hypothetical protein AMOR_47150 [Anaeromyxobacter oryzae]
MVATLLLFLLIAVAAAPTWSLSQGAGPAEERSRTDAERAPKDALSLWLHDDGAGYSRIVLETANGVYVREWRSAESLDERTRHEVREALDTNTPPSRAVLIKVRPEVKFVTLKGLMLACGPKEPAGYRTYVEVVAQFPIRVLGPRR